MREQEKEEMLKREKCVRSDRIKPLSDRGRHYQITN